MFLQWIVLRCYYSLFRKKFSIGASRRYPTFHLQVLSILFPSVLGFDLVSQVASSGFSKSKPIFTATTVKIKNGCLCSCYNWFLPQMVDGLHYTPLSHSDTVFFWVFWTAVSSRQSDRLQSLTGPASLEDVGFKSSQINSCTLIFISCSFVLVLFSPGLLFHSEKSWQKFQQADAAPWYFLELSAFRAHHSLQIFQGLPLWFGLRC